MEPLIPAAIASTIGVALLVVAGRHFARRRAFISDSVTSSGVVVAVREERDAQDHPHQYRYPQIRFRTPTGREVTFESGMARSGNAWRLGEAVPVRYQRERPESAEIDRFATLWGATLLFALLGVIFLGVGVSIWLGAIPV